MIDYSHSEQDKYILFHKATSRSSVIHMIQWQWWYNMKPSSSSGEEKKKKTKTVQRWGRKPQIYLYK